MCQLCCRFLLKFLHMKFIASTSLQPVSAPWHTVRCTISWWSIFIGIWSSLRREMENCKIQWQTVFPQVVWCQCIMNFNWLLVKCMHRIACRMQKSMLVSCLCFCLGIGIMWWKEMLNIGGFHSLHIFFSPEINKITYSRTPICIKLFGIGFLLQNVI